VMIVVPKPELPPGLDTERIALYLDQGHRLDYYADARWSARLDELLQNFLIEKVRQLRLEQHVEFHNKYMQLPELLNFLSVTDVYLATPLDPNHLQGGCFSPLWATRHH